MSLLFLRRTRSKYLPSSTSSEDSGIGSPTRMTAAASAAAETPKTSSVESSASLRSVICIRQVIRATVFLRVFARKKDGAYYRRCRQPGSDFDETRTRGAPGPKMKFGDPRLAHSACVASPGAAKTPIFFLLKIRFFGHIFFISNRSDMFAMGF